MVLWLRLHTSNARGTGSIPGWGAKIPHAMRWPRKYIKKSVYEFIINIKSMKIKRTVKKLKMETDIRFIIFFSGRNQNNNNRNKT